MDFSLMSTVLRFHDGKMTARLRKNGDLVYRTVSLDKYVEQIKGPFDVDSTGWCANLNYPVLHSNFIGDGNSTSLDLSLYKGNINGALESGEPHESILLSASCITLQHTKMQALCLGPDGKMHYSEIDLSNYYANRNGEFVSGDRHFAATGRNFSIERTSKAVTLKGDLRDYDGKYCSASVDLSICILNKNSALVFEKHDGSFGRDGPLVQFLEQVPILGFVVAGIQAIAGNPYHAKRTLAYCADSTICCVGITIGAFFGGPVGAAIGAGIATPIAILEEISLSNLIEDPRLKAQFEEVTITRFIYETLRNMGVALVARYLGSYLETASKELLEGLIHRLMVSLGSKAVGKGGSNIAGTLLKKILYALKTECLTQN